MHVLLRSLDFAILAVTFLICIELKTHAAHQDTRFVADYAACELLVAIIAAFVGLEACVGLIYARNYRSGVPAAELLRRTWAWMLYFDTGANLISCVLLCAGVGVYFVGGLNGNDGSVAGVAAAAAAAADDDAAAALRAATRRLGGLEYTAETEHQRAEALLAHQLASAEAASWHSVMPLVWLFLGLGFLIKFSAFVNQTVQPYTSLSIFVLSVRHVLRGELLVFMNIFLVFIGAFVFTMLVIFPEDPSEGAGKLPQTPQFTHWFPATHAILMSGFTGEPLELELDPMLFGPLGVWQKLNLGAFLSIYVIYIFLSLILLLNLLIALLGSTFSKTREGATLQGRLAFAKVILRLELVADFFGVETHVGEFENGKHDWVWSFRSVVRDRDGELSRFYTDENVFDPAPEAKQAAAANGALRESVASAADLTEVKEALASVKTQLGQLAATIASSKAVDGAESEVGGGHHRAAARGADEKSYAELRTAMSSMHAEMSSSVTQLKQLINTSARMPTPTRAAGPSSPESEGSVAKSVAAERLARSAQRKA
jgi:hypothetical protein